VVAGGRPRQECNNTESWESSTFGRRGSAPAGPNTFTIDADGVLKDEHVGDSNMEGKLKNLVAQAE